jgi:hypothetical protein
VASAEASGKRRHCLLLTRHRPGDNRRPARTLTGRPAPPTVAAMGARRRNRYGQEQRWEAMEREQGRSYFLVCRTS